MYTAVIDQVPEEFDVEPNGGGGFVVSVGLAESNDGQTGVSVDVSLCPFEDDEGALIHEFAYEIAVSPYDQSEMPFATQDRNIAFGYIPEDVRSLVLPCVVAALKALLDAVHPEFIYRVTKGLQLPDKALYKHRLITDILVSQGYSVLDEGTDGHNRQFWLQGRG